MNTDKKAANAVGGKTARACDNCILKRARWYCAADDAFLCQGCDASVHSANPLARRHERVRLKTASLKPPSTEQAYSLENSLPPWHHGFTRKARTPRNSHTKLTKEPMPMLNPLPLVPEMGNEEASPYEDEEQLLYRVPVFDPFAAELCNKASASENGENVVAEVLGTESKALLLSDYGHDDGIGDHVDDLTGFLHCDDHMDLDEFAADVETLLGRGLDEDSFGMEGLGLLDCKEDVYCFGNGKVVKVEELEEEEDAEAVAACHVNPELDTTRETFDLNFNYGSPTTGHEEVEEKMGCGATIESGDGTCKAEEMSRRLSLRLDYETIINAWASQGSPWMTGDRPHLNLLDECWPECMGTCGMEQVHHHHPYGGGVVVGQVAAMRGDGGREARVTRYREKRRTRLFSKKIRYEVRKLNAEKRPRMKGRFVKRVSSFA